MEVKEKIQIHKYTEYKDSGVEWLGEIPKHWEVKRLGHYFDERKIKVSDREYPPLSVTKQGILPQLDNAAKSNDGDNRKLVLENDFVINSRSDRKGSSGVSKLNGSVSLINIVLEPIGVYADYSNYILKSYSFIEEFYRVGHGIVADLWTTRYDEMKNIKIVFPPKEEQTAIANFLDEKCEKIDQTIARKEKLIELLKERKQIIIQNAVTGKVVWNKEKEAWTEPVEVKDSGIEWIGEIPELWEVIKAGKLSRILRGASPRPSGDPRYFGSTDVHWIVVGDITKDENAYLYESKEYLTKAGKSESRYIKAGTFVLTNSGATLGVPKILGIDGCINDGILAFLKIKKEKISDLFLYYFFTAQTARLRDEMNQGATQPNLNTDLVKQIPVPIAPLKEQSRIISFIENKSKQIRHAIEKQLNQIEKLKEYKSSVINSAVTGKIKVSNYDSI